MVSGAITFVRDGSPFVGRAAELATFDQLWQDAAQGRRGAALVGGEPGVGKSRLASELAGRVARSGGSVRYGTCDEGFAVPYQPFVEAITSAAWQQLEPKATGDPESDRYRLFEAVADHLAAASLVQPLLLVLDDLHWATRPTLLLLAHLLNSARSMRVLVVGTYRDAAADRRGRMLLALVENAAAAEHAYGGDGQYQSLHRLPS
jgi:predicted ATPase